MKLWDELVQFKIEMNGTRITCETFFIFRFYIRSKETKKVEVNSIKKTIIS